MSRGFKTLLVVLTVAFALPGVASAATTSSGHLRVAIDSASHTADFTKTAAQRNVVILHEWEQPRLRSLKTANPGLKVLMYKNLSAVSTTQGGYTGTGVSKEETTTHDDWLLKNTSGQPFAFNGASYLYAADIGLRTYQDRWASNVLAKLKLNDWDGVFVDDTNPTMKYHYSVTSVKKYPSDAAYAAATGSALSVIGPKLQAAGMLVVPNFGEWRVHRTVVSSWLQYVSGGMEEMFTKYGETPGTGYFMGGDWDAQLALAKETQALGKLFLGISHSERTDQAAARYGWATMLLAANGNASFALHRDYTNETWFAEYDYDLGSPSGAETKLASGIHRRAYTRGLVLVNPTNTSVAVSFGGRYRGSGLTARTSTVMGPHTGLILLADSVAAAAVAKPAAPVFQAVVAPLPAASSARADTPPAASAPASKAAVTIPRNARRSLRVRVTCRSKARPCRRLVTVVLRHKGKRAQVGRRKVTLRRTARVSVQLNTRGRAALKQGRRLRAIVRAQV
ncbi:MAG TPA: putative glycoside hydrolase [Solirubrobacteraceae bacterium]|nr:putative glycoside hydrolase [Solirubrobacteraceae bacterium]